MAVARIETRPAPEWPDDEKVILGVTLLDETKAPPDLKPHQFSARHRPIWSAVCELRVARTPVNSATVSDLLERKGKLEQSGGAAYIASLTDGIPSVVELDYYVRRVREAALVRELGRLSQEVARQYADGGIPASDIVREAREWVERLSVDVGASREPNRFEKLTDDRFRLELLDVGISLEVDRLRRERHELLGELCVRCKLPGARVYDGTLSIADFNLSSARARSERANLLAKRAAAEDLDWTGYLEELCQRVLAAERAGAPAVDLRELERPDSDDAVRVEGISLPRRHPAITFGDGGAAKSYLALYLVGRLAEQGLGVALFDWELAGEDHRERLERLFGKVMPRVSYARCERPLVYEADRLSRIVRDGGIDYAVFDSVAFACDGPPEAAEVAGRYFRAVRQIGIGSLHVAHISKSEGGDSKPFGSVFWHNGARSTYFVQLADTSEDGRTLTVGLFNRKANLGPVGKPTGFQITFEADRTFFARCNPADTPDLAEKMSLRHRIAHAVRSGGLTVDELSQKLDAKADTIERTVRRYRDSFRVLEGGKVVLPQRDA